MKIALYQNIISDRGPVILEVNKYFESDDTIVRVSEIMEVEFKELGNSPKEIMKELKIAAAMKAVEEAKSKLKALNHEV